MDPKGNIRTDQTWREISHHLGEIPRQNAVLLKQSDVDGSTPLHLCAKQGHAECVELLLQWPV